MTTITAKIYEASGLTLQHTTTDVVAASGTWIKNGVGRGSMTFPGQDGTTATETTRGRVCHVTITRGATTQAVALFNIEERTFSLNENGEEMITISGSGFEDRIGRHLIYGEIHDGSHGVATDDIEQIMTFQPGWSLHATSNTGTTNGTHHTFKNATVLQALNAAAEQSGEYWRLHSLTTIAREITWLTVPSGTLSYNFTLYFDSSQVTDESSEGYIIRMDRGYDQSETVTRVYVYGAGTGDDRLTMSGATYSPPAGYSLYDDTSLLVNDTLETAGEYNERELTLSDISLPELKFSISDIDTTEDAFLIRGDHTTLFTGGYVFEVEENDDIADGTQFTTVVTGSSYDEPTDLTWVWVDENLTASATNGYIVPTSTALSAAQETAANALAKSAYYWLRDRTGSETYHRIRCIYHLNVQPGDKVHLVYDNGRLSLDEVHQVVEVTQTVDRATGIRYTDLVTAPLETLRMPPKDEDVASGLMATMQHLLKFGAGSTVDAGEILPTMGEHLAAQDPHPTYLLADGGRTLVGNLAVGAGYTIDGVDISAHAADTDIHADHTSISITGGTGLGGGGTIAANRTITLNTPGTLTVSSSNTASGNHTHAITASSDPGAAAALLKTSAAGLLQLNSLYSSGGDFSSDNYVSQLTGWEISYAGDADFRSIFADELHVRAFIADIEQALAGGEIVSKAVAIISRDFSLPYQGDIINVDTTSDYVTVTGDQTGAIDDGQTFSIAGSTGNDGNYTVSSSELRITGNTRIYTNEDITDATVDGEVRFWRVLYLEDLPGFADTAVFATDDWVRLRVIDRSGGGLVVADAWGTVQGYTDLSGGEQSWVFVCRDDGSVAGDTVFAGAIAIDYGASGDGYWEVTALDSDGPYSQIVTWATDPTVSGNHTLRTRMGNLDGVTDTDFSTSPNGWGFYSDNVFLKGDIWAASGNVVIDGDGISVATVSTSTNYIRFMDGATERAGLRMHENSGANFSWFTFSMTGQYNDDRFFFTGANVHAENGLTTSDDFRVDLSNHLIFADVSAGRVGIGTNNAVYKLDVQDTSGITWIRAYNSGTDTGAGYMMENDAQRWNIYVNGGDGDNLTFRDATGSNNWMVVETGVPADAIRVDSNGYVGIGTTPFHVLDVYGNISSDYIARFHNDGNSTNRGGIEVWGGEDSNPTHNAMVFRDGDGNAIGTVTGDGAGGVNYNQTSDESTKENAQTLGGALSALKAARAVSYQGKGAPQGRGRQVGFVAQELQAHIPEAVSVGEGGLMQIAPMRIIPYLVGAVQELTTRVEALEAT